jgi:hypothetical protein
MKDWLAWMLVAAILSVFIIFGGLMLRTMISYHHTQTPGCFAVDGETQCR